MKCKYCGDHIGVGDGVDSIPRYRYGNVDVCDRYCSEECHHAHERSRYEAVMGDSCDAFFETFGEALFGPRKKE
jgi:hypothetical protein